MLTAGEIRQFLEQDAASEKKQRARTGERYYEGDHDIRDYRLFFFDPDGILREDHNRANTKIPHPFYAELVDQGVQYLMSSEQFAFSDDQTLQGILDDKINYNDLFRQALADAIEDASKCGFAWVYVTVDPEGNMVFRGADATGVIEVDGRYTEDGQDHIIYHYVDRVDLEGHTVTRIQDWDAQQTVYWMMRDNGDIVRDEYAEVNPRPHLLYTEDDGDDLYQDGFGFIPFFRLDNNRKQLPLLKTVKPLIDDYDLMASSLSNNLIDFDHPIYAVKGFDGDNLDELSTNLRTKKTVGVSADGGIDVITIDVPYQARVAKLELDEKSIYRFGMGLNMAGLKDTAATTNMAIKVAYALLDMRCQKMEGQVKAFLRRIVEVILDAENKSSSTGYRSEDVWFKFTPVTPTNGQEDAQIGLIEAQTKQAQLNSLLMLQTLVGDDTLLQKICEYMEWDYDDIKDQLPEDPEADVAGALEVLNERQAETGAGGAAEGGTEDAEVPPGNV